MAKPAEFKRAGASPARPAVRRMKPSAEQQNRALPTPLRAVRQGVHIRRCRANAVETLAEVIPRGSHPWPEQKARYKGSAPQAHLSAHNSRRPSPRSTAAQRGRRPKPVRTGPPTGPARRKKCIAPTAVPEQTEESRAAARGVRCSKKLSRGLGRIGRIQKPARTCQAGWFIEAEAPPPPTAATGVGGSCRLAPGDDNRGGFGQS